MSRAHVPLTNGMFATIDASDLAMVEGYRWHAMPVRKGHGHYAYTSVSVDGKQTTIYMHRLITGAGKGLIVDHVNGDGLDNTQANLRVGTQAQNMANASIRPQNTSGYIGVTWRSDSRNWKAQIQVNGRCISLGSFDTAEEAALARAEHAKSIHGEWASRMEAA